MTNKLALNQLEAGEQQPHKEKRTSRVVYQVELIAGACPTAAATSPIDSNMQHAQPMHVAHT